MLAVVVAVVVVVVVAVVVVAVVVVDVVLVMLSKIFSLLAFNLFGRHFDTFFQNRPSGKQFESCAKNISREIENLFCLEGITKKSVWL